MSALSAAKSSGVESAILDLARPAFQAAIWQWYDANQGRVLLHKWFITIRLSDVRFMIEEIAGPDPVTATASPPQG